MASNATNASIDRLREQHTLQQRELRMRHAAQKRALARVTVQQSALEAAEREREAATERLNAAVAEAHEGRDVAVAVLTRLCSSVQDVAGLIGPSVAEVRRAVQRAPEAVVNRQVELLLASGAKRRRLRAAPVEERSEPVSLSGHGGGGEAEMAGPH
ncbi:hypothetical protein JIG36_48715 [Actinoplanes sp. LDG1-06]|uniref:Uncharacterized protein n=1 Tax=Paractinoplanes ovalisporus TaxID=2810368 RepID=A0ABS2AU81_9ACTN|nr:hypothetical protein [Actinoplanes ovalisporus]MBM2623405.1 hypothetical protein [Actinoplanes ovalisporus]